MPSRSPVPELLLSPAALPPLLHVNRHHHHFHHLDLIITLLSITFLLSVFTFAFVLFHFLSRRRNATAPSDLKPPHRYSFSLLRRATSSFSTSNRLGQGGFGSVYKGILPTGKSVAVKVMDSGALQGEREFNNELSLASRIENSTQVLPILGYSSDSKRQRLVLVYELMSNGSLQDALLHRKPLELMEWKVRFDIVKDVVDGIYFLHHLCDPPVIHGDIKPSNVLLDCDFKAKISDFGLARVRNDDDIHVVEVVAEDGDVVAANVKLNKKRKAGENGLKDPSAFNDALLLKQLWRFKTEPDLLVSQIYKGKYFVQSTLEGARMGSSPSHIWRHLFKLREVLQAGSYVEVAGTRPVWKGSASGEYTTKSAYGLITTMNSERQRKGGECSNQSHIRQFWRKVWSAKVPPKVRLTI